MTIDAQFAPNKTDGDVSSWPVPFEEFTAIGAAVITKASGMVNLIAAGAGLATIDDPPAGMEGAILTIVATTTQAHTLTYANGFGGGATTLGTYSTAGESLQLIASGGVWNIVANNGVVVS